MFNYNKNAPQLQGIVTTRMNKFVHLVIRNPSKNGVFRSFTYHVKSFWKMWQPEMNTSRIAFNLDFVVGVSQPHELKTMSPFGSISAMRLPCNLTDVNPSESTLTEVLDLRQSVRVAIAACIWRSILRVIKSCVIYSYSMPWKNALWGRWWTLCELSTLWLGWQVVRGRVWQIQILFSSPFLVLGSHTDGLPT